MSWGNLSSRNRCDILPEDSVVLLLNRLCSIVEKIYGSIVFDFLSRFCLLFNSESLQFTTQVSAMMIHRSFYDRYGHFSRLGIIHLLCNLHIGYRCCKSLCFHNETNTLCSSMIDRHEQHQAKIIIFLIMHPSDRLYKDSCSIICAYVFYGVAAVRGCNR
jgi:hypothetical protein